MPFYFAWQRIVFQCETFFGGLQGEFFQIAVGQCEQTGGGRLVGAEDAEFDVAPIHVGGALGQLDVGDDGVIFDQEHDGYCTGVDVPPPPTCIYFTGLIVDPFAGREIDIAAAYVFFQERGEQKIFAEEILIFD